MTGCPEHQQPRYGTTQNRQCDTEVVDIDWTHQLTEQLDWHWREQLRPRFNGLADDEYFWEPVANAWNIRRRGHGRAAIAAGSGEFVIDFAYPEPSPAPVTTIAWRLAHLIVGVFGARVASHFGGLPVDYQTFGYAGTAAQALQQLDDVYAAWLSGVKSLGDVGLARPCGAAEGPFAEYPMAALVLQSTVRHCITVLRLPSCATYMPTANRPRLARSGRLTAAVVIASPAAFPIRNRAVSGK